MNNRIKELRKSLSMTQDEFAARLAITKASISRIESGVNNPSDQTIKLICSEFGVRREWLEFGDLPMRSAETPAEDAALASVISAMAGQSENKKRLLHIIAEMPDDLLEAFVKYLNTKKAPEA